MSVNKRIYRVFKVQDIYFKLVTAIVTAMDKAQKVTKYIHSKGIWNTSEKSLFCTKIIRLFSVLPL